MQEKIEHDKKLILEKALNIIPFEGWSDKMLRLAFKEAKIDYNLHILYFPRGNKDLLEEILISIEKEFKSKIDFDQLKQLKVKEKIFYLVKLRLDCAEQYKECLKTGISLYLIPNNYLNGFQRLWNTSSEIWRTIGDKSLDFNYYSKRTTLSMLYLSTLLFWLEDDSTNYCKSWEFLNNRINNIMQFGKFTNKIKELPNKFSKLPFIRLLKKR